MNVEETSRFGSKKGRN